MVSELSGHGSPELSPLHAAARLQYLGEADFGVMSVENFPEQVRGMLQSVSRDLIETEQYMDFLRNRAFRQTLLCRREVVLERPARPEALLKMRVASSARPEGEVDVQSGETVTFRRRNSVLTTNDPVAKAAMLQLTRAWPASVPFVELASMARSVAAGRPVAVDSDVLSPATERLAETLLRCFATSQVDLHVAPGDFVAEVTLHPSAAPLACVQAQSSAQVTNRLHETVSLDDFQRHVLRALDGSRDHEALADLLSEKVGRGEVVIHHDGRRLSEPEEIRRIVAESVGETLGALAQQALLVG